MDRINLTYLTYFLDAYWNEMGDEVHGTIDRAAAAFAAESKEYRLGLISDLNEALKRRLLADDFSDPVYDSTYWSRFHRCISKDDAAVVKGVLEGS